MSDNAGTGKVMQDEQINEEQSPAEKLEGDERPTGSLVPGAENPDSEEIKEEKNWNTE